MVSGSRPVRGWKCTRPTTARSWAASRRAARRKLALRSTPPSVRCPTAPCTRASGDPRPDGEARRRARRRDRSHDLGGSREAHESGANRGRACTVDVHHGRRRGAHARRRRRADGCVARRLRKARAHSARSDRGRRSDLTVQLPVQPRRAQGRSGSRRRLCGRAQAGIADTALGPAPRRARGGGGTTTRLAQRRLRAGERDRRRARRGRARGAHHVHRLGRGRLEAEGASAAQAREPRARQRDTRDRGRRRRPGGRRHTTRGERVLLRRPELHLGAADLCRALGVRPVPRAVPSSRRGSGRRRSCRRRHRRRSRHLVGERDRVLEWIEEARGLGARDTRRRRARRRAHSSHRRRRRTGRVQGRLRGGLRPALHGRRRTTRSTRRSPFRTGRATACRPGSSRAT